MSIYLKPDTCVFRKTAFRRMLAGGLILLLSHIGKADEQNIPRGSPAKPQTLVLRLDGEMIVARPALYGHNFTAEDWHGTLHNNRSAILWDIKNNQPDPSWTALTHAWPLRVARYHSGNLYPWRDAVGPISERKVIKDQFGRPLATNAGLQEFLEWLDTLPSPRSEIVLIASPFRPTQELVDLVAYCNASSGAMAELRTAHGHPEPYGVRYWELGNETDWLHRTDLDVTRADSEREKKNKLLPSEYVALCRERIEAMRAIDPTIEFIAHAQTAPWPSSNPRWPEWHREVIRGLGDYINAIAVHPYYDGYTVPYTLASVDAIIADIKKLSPPGRKITVAITEHSRWVNYNNLDERPQSWGLQGAISSGDFLLRAMARPEISMANYWCYLSRGPWRVLNADWEQGGANKFGTGAFMLFKLLNDALLPRYRLLTPEPSGSVAAKGYLYTATVAQFLDPDSGAQSIVAVNRSSDQPFILEFPELSAPGSSAISYSVITGSSLAATNVAATPNAVSLSQRSLTITPGAPLRLELPPRSVASWRWIK